MLHIINIYGGTDITLARSDRYISIPRIRCSHRHLMTARSKSSMRVCTATSLQILSSCRSRSCVGMMSVMVWACCRLDGFPSNHGWSAREQIAPSPSGATDDEYSTCDLSDTSDGSTIMSACTLFATREQPTLFFLFLKTLG